MTHDNEIPKVTLTDDQWAYLKEQEDKRTSVAVELANRHLEVLDAALTAMKLQAPTTQEQDDRFIVGKRDYFAGQAMGAMIGKAPFFDRDGEFENPVDMVQFKIDMSESAYAYADAMLKAREVSE